MGVVFVSPCWRMRLGEHGTDVRSGRSSPSSSYSCYLHCSPSSLYSFIAYVPRAPLNGTGHQRVLSTTSHGGYGQATVGRNTSPLSRPRILPQRARLTLSKVLSSPMRRPRMISRCLRGLRSRWNAPYAWRCSSRAIVCGSFHAIISSTLTRLTSG